MKTKVLVTGAGGFIGSTVSRKLVDDYEVIAVDHTKDSFTRISDLKEKIIFEGADLTNKDTVDKIFRKYKPDVVAHLATHGVYSYQQIDFEKIIIGNYFMTLNLLESSRKYNVKKFINTGSVFEYGTKKGKLKEDDIRLNDIINKYSAVKLATTALANSYTEDFKLITLRPFTAYGKGEDPTRFIKATIDRAIRNEDLRIVKEVVRDFIYVEDIADAYQSAIKKDFESGVIVNVGSGKGITLEAVCKIIKKLTKSKSNIIFDEKYIRGKESACFADINLARKVLNWSPHHTLLMGLKKMLYS